MAHVRIRRLSIKAFRSFKNEATFDFDEGGLVLVRGVNHDANDSSGAGKTSLLEALAYAFDISQFPATEHQCWLTEEPFQVELEFDTPAGTAILKRGKVNSLKVGDQKTISGAKAVKEAVAGLVGLSPDILRALVYRPQREPGLFISMTDAKKKEFLTELLGLGQFEAEAEAAQKRISALEKEADTAKALAVAADAAIPPMVEEPVLQDENPGHLETLRQKLEEYKEVISGVLKQKEHAELQVNEVARIYDVELAAAIAPIQAERNCVEQSKVGPATDYAAAWSSVNRRLEHIQGLISAAKKEWQNGLTQLELEAKSTRRLISVAEKEAAPLAGLQTRLRKTETDIATLRSAKCPTCEREWITAESKLLELEMESSKLVEAIENCLKAQEIANQENIHLVSVEGLVESTKASNPVPPDLEEALAALTADLATIEAERKTAWALVEAERRAKLAELDAQLANLKRSFREQKQEALDRMMPALQEAEKAVASLYSDERAIRTRADDELRRLMSVASANAWAKTQHEQAVRVRETALKRAGDAANAFHGAMGSLGAEKDFLACVGRDGFLGLVFDDVLHAISDETNRILAEVPNVAHVTIRFESERETQDGKLRKEIKPQILANGRPVSLKAGLSGGMQVAVELAVDIALAKVVSERTGMFPGWMVLDEAFDGLGINAKKACLAILAKAAADRLILVVDHSTEVREGFDTVIDIALRDGVSIVE